MRLTFDADHVQKLLEISRNTEQKQPILEQMLIPDYWRDDLPKERRDLLMKEYGKEGLAFSARLEDVDRTKLPTGLILVGDQGVYLMSQASNEDVKALGVDHVAYANESNPRKMEHYYWDRNKRASFGPDDGTEFIPEDSIKLLPGGKFLIEITPNELRILSEPGADPDDRKPPTP